VDLTRSNLLGSGAYGTVYASKHGDINVAVKRHAGKSGGWNQTVLRETFAMCSIPPHRNVAELLFARSNGKVLLVMPLYSKSLYQHLKTLKNPVPSADIEKWSSQLVQAASHMHSHGFIHRDIKLENIFLDADNNAILGDLGMARCVHDSSSTLSPNVCSLWTRPPELLENKDFEYTEKLDAWSLGVVLLACAAGKYVLRCESGGTTLPAIRHLVLGPENTRLQLLREACNDRTDLPTSFYVLLLKLLVYDPSRRSSLVDLREDDVPWLPKSVQLTEHDVSPHRTMPDFSKRPLCTKQIGIWIWNISKQLGYSVSTRFYCLQCWIRSHTESTSDALQAAAACSLVGKVLESVTVPPSTWSKSVQSKCSALYDAENAIMITLHGNLVTIEKMKEWQLAAAFLMLVATPLSYAEIMKDFETLLHSTLWKEAQSLVPEIAKECVNLV